MNNEMIEYRERNGFVKLEKVNSKIFGDTINLSHSTNGYQATSINITRKEAEKIVQLLTYWLNKK